MPDPMMYYEDAFVVLESDRPEQFLTPDEMLEKLIAIARSHPEVIPQPLQKYPTLEEQARRLRDNYCELDLGEPEQYLQWYAVRLEK